MTTERNSPLYLVATDDGSDEAYAITRRAGLDLAKQDGATVLLYDRTSESYLTDPYPVGPWSPEDDAVSEDTELDRQMLENLGRHYLVEQWNEAEAQGVQVRAHLARGAAAEALADAVSRYQPDVVILPEEVNDPSLAERVTGNSLEKFRRSVDVEVRLVDHAGQMRTP